MVLKVLAIVVVLILIYMFFFKKGREINISKKDEQIEDDLVECATCKVYVSQKEAILSNGKFYCSKECLENK